MKHLHRWHYYVDGVFLRRCKKCAANERQIHDGRWIRA